MKQSTITRYIVLSAAMLLSVCCEAKDNCIMDGYEPIPVKEAAVQSSPRGSSIQASINGHSLMVTFTENLGQVAVEITTAAGASVDCASTITPNGLQFSIPNAADYIITFTLPNGDEYYGEFTVSD
jgi:hypothetical protein